LFEKYPKLDYVAINYFPELIPLIVISVSILFYYITLHVH